MTSLTSLQLWLNKPKIDQRVQELERQIGQIAHGEAGQGNPELHEFLVTLVTQLFEAEAQAKKADKKEAQATAALLATVQAQRENTILEPSTKATIDALVGEGFNAPRTLRDHVKRWADMISAEYAGDTLRQAQLAKALADRLSATPDLSTEQQREDQVRKAIIGSSQPEGVADASRAQPRSRHSVRCCNRLPRSRTRSSVRAALQRQDHHASHEAARGQRRCNVHEAPCRQRRLPEPI
jgi:hypothetical protein